MVPSEQSNRPQWSGQGFEIWFFVVVVPDQDQALWVRLTRFADGEAKDARIWAVVSEGGGVTAQRQVLALDAMRCAAPSEPFAVEVGEASLEHGRSRGRCGRITWEFEYEASDPDVARMPRLPGFLPLGTRASHPHAEAAVTGFVELDGRRISLDGGQFTQMHIWGDRRVEWLRWAWIPRFVVEDAHAHDTELELTAVAPKDGGPNLCSLWVRVRGEVLDNSTLGKSIRAELIPVRPGVVHHVGSRRGRRVVVRVWAADATFAGWDYRQLGRQLGDPARDLHVAQTNQARAEIEIYERAGLGWRPQQRLRSRCGALEFHGLEAFDNFAYGGWDEDEVDVQPRRAPPPAKVEVPDPPEPGEWIPTSAPTRIVALGLSYADHARETGEGREQPVFEIDPSSWTAGGGELLRPSSDELRGRVAKLDPGALGELADFGFLPAMLDYEVELGLVLVEGLADVGAVEGLASGGRVGLVLANDLSARSVQILGEGQAKRLEFWTAAKSLPGFTPTGPRTFIPARFGLDAWPELELETRVNGALRQQARLAMMLESPRQLLRRVVETAGSLPPGTLILTGTPAGVAFTVPRWKRVLGDRLLDRAGKLRAALAGFTAGTAFLRPGDRVEVRGGFLGAIEHLVVPAPEP